MEQVKLTFRAVHPIMPSPATTQKKNEIRSEPRFGNFQCSFFLLACSYRRLSAGIMADMSVAEDDVSMTSPLTTTGTGPATTTTTTTATTTEVSAKEGTMGLSEEEETQQRKEAVQQSASLSLYLPPPCSNSPYSLLHSRILLCRFQPPLRQIHVDIAFQRPCEPLGSSEHRSVVQTHAEVLAET